MTTRPSDFAPTITVEVRRGRVLHVWRAKGMELAYRETGRPDDAARFEAFQDDIWAALESHRAGSPPAHALKSRHTLGPRPSRTTIEVVRARLRANSQPAEEE